MRRGSSTFINYRHRVKWLDMMYLDVWGRSTYVLKGIVTLSDIVFVDQVKWIPLEIESFISSLCLSVGVPKFILNHINVDIDSGLKTFLFHPIAAIAVEVHSVATHSTQI